MSEVLLNPAALPATWVLTSLGAVIDYGRTRKAEPSQLSGEDWILELEDIEKDSSKLLQRMSFAQRQSKSAKNRFQAGDVLYGKLRPYLNKVMIADQPGYCTTEIVPIKTGAQLDNRYLFYWLKHPAFLKYVEAESHGMNMPRLGTDIARAAPFVLAPREEQTRIANQLDKLLTRIQACNDRLDAIPATLKRFRQAVLAAATSGLLTEDWRREIGCDTDDWNVIKLRSIVRASANGLSKRNAEVGTATIVLRLADFKNSKRVVGNERAIKLSEKELAKYSLMPGDILVVRVNGSADLAGRLITYESQGENIEAYCDHFIRLRLDSSRATPEFIRFVVNSGAGRRYIESVLVTSAGQKTINQTSLLELEVALPPITEQTEIVRRVEALFKLADLIETRCNAVRAEAQRLIPLLLAKAFRGELVPQDPNDESASVLLERIKENRESQVPHKNNGRAAKDKPMKISPPSSLSEIIYRMEEDCFTFEQLRELVSRDYESLKGELFTLLADSESGLKQVFDVEAQLMKFERVRK